VDNEEKYEMDREASAVNELNVIVGVCREDDPDDVDEAYGAGTYARLFPPSKNAAFVKSLRELADYFEARPDMPAPYTSELVYYPDKNEEAVSQFARWFAPCKKEGDDTFFRVRREFGALQLSAAWYRNEVCTPVVVGQVEVEEDVVVSKVTEKRKVLKDKIEWRCPAVLKEKQLP
jgi:hypothetical protein